MQNNFGQDVAFLEKYVETILLGEEGADQIAVVPAYQGRTMTSTTSGQDGTSFGWINYDRVAAGDLVPQINLYGGEDRFWLSPEGGQYSIFFDPEAPMEFSHWRTPAIIDSEPFELSGRDDRSALFHKKGSVVNYNRFQFDVMFDRTVELLSRESVKNHLGVNLPDEVRIVGHESRNTLTNIGNKAWKPETGLLGIWMLCMNKPSDQATIIVPFQAGDESDLGPVVNADYFGKLDESRLKVDREKSLIYFLGDGRLRSKLGLSFGRARPVLGAWDNSIKALTITQFNLPDETGSGYTNNLWEIQKDPYGGDVINSYNDGPNESGGMLGPFYELETLSPALALDVSESYTHIHRTIHLEGEHHTIDPICRHVFGVGIDVVSGQFMA